MTSENDILDVSSLNPWWFTGGLNQDFDLQRVLSSPLDYTPRPIKPEDCLKPNIYTLRGPRRAGKTVAVKLLIKELIEKDLLPARSILWLTFDTVRTLAQAEALLVGSVEKYKPKLVCIDEVTALHHWQRVIKKLRDTGPLSSCCVVLTGSSAHDLKSGAERLAGRKGENEVPDKVLLPMSFEEFVKQLEKASFDISREALSKLYLKVGGFPFRVEECIKKLQPDEKGNAEEITGEESLQVFDDVLFYEILRRRLDRSIAIEVLGRIAQLQTSAISYEAFAKQLSVAKDTARKYLDVLGDAFLLATYSSYDTSRGRVAPKRDKKLLWIDPALAFLPKWMRQGEALDEAGRAELSVGSHLLRCYEERLFEGVSAPRNVFTWKSKSGKEVDFLVVDKSRKFLFPVEVKYQNQISDWDFQTIEKAFGKGVIVSLRDARKREQGEAKPLHEMLLQLSKEMRK